MTRASTLFAFLLLAACAEKPAATASVTKAANAANAAHAEPVRRKPTAKPNLCEHGVPADLCTKCLPELVPAFKELGDWCEEHGVPESHCRQCNPQLTFDVPNVPADWCPEHAVPESMCTKCNPSLVPKFVEAGDFCREHGVPESVCPWCHPELLRERGLAPPAFPEPGTRIRLKTAATAAEAGIRTTRVERRPFARTLEVVGRITFNQNKLARLSARGEALVVEVNADVGDEVKTGQRLASLASAGVGEQQARISAATGRVEAAEAKLKREASLVARGISPRKDLEAAEAEAAEARAELDAARAALGAAGASLAGKGGRYALAAPFAGVVVKRDAVAGRYASDDQVLFDIADLSTVWAQLDVPEEDAPVVRAGQTVRIELEGNALAPIEARIDRMSPVVDPHTRTVRARVELDNPEGVLRDGAFVRARIAVSGSTNALLVPAGAVQRAQGTPLVFVRKQDGLYEPRKVDLGATTGDQVEILHGIDPGAEVVTTGAFLLKTELLRDSIGAGCCEVGEGG